jgi:hypothetical protein
VLNKLIHKFLKNISDIVGILAYGSLIDEPGNDILGLISKRVNTFTPFPVEYARTSKSRENAPTLIPFGSGLSVRAQILVLSPGITEQVASNLLYQRETRQVERHYARPKESSITNNTVLIEALSDFENIQTVLYTKIGCNIPNLSPIFLAESAIASSKGRAGAERIDGIRYLINAKRNGIETSLSSSYEHEILRLTSTLTLKDAYAYCRTSLSK